MSGSQLNTVATAPVAAGVLAPVVPAVVAASVVPAVVAPVVPAASVVAVVVVVRAAGGEDRRRRQEREPSEDSRRLDEASTCVHGGSFAGGSYWCGARRLIAHRGVDGSLALAGEREDGDRQHDDDDRRAERSWEVEQPVAVGELDAETPAPDEALADDGGDDRRAGGDAEPAGDVWCRGREHDVPEALAALTTERVDEVDHRRRGRVEAGPCEHEHREEHEHRRERPHGALVVADDPGEQREEGEQRGRRQQHDERHRHPGDEPEPGCGERRAEPEHGADHERDERGQHRGQRRAEVGARRGGQVVEDGGRRRHDDRRDVLDLDPRPPQPDEHDHDGEHRARLVGDMARTAARASRARALRADRCAVAAGRERPQERADAVRDEPTGGTDQGGRPQPVGPTALHRGDQEHAEPAVGAVPLTEHGAGERGRCGELEPVGGGRPRRRELHRPEPAEPTGSEGGGDVVRGRRCGGEPDRGRDEHREEHGQRGDGDRTPTAPEHDRAGTARRPPMVRRWRRPRGAPRTPATGGRRRRRARRGRQRRPR